MKTRLFQLFAILISIISINILLPKPPKKNYHVVYNHGFGQSAESAERSAEYYSSLLGNSYSAPVYPDAPGNLSKGVFYTKPAVHTLANHLLNKVNEGKDAIILVDFSMGGRISTNCLVPLINQDLSYFEGSSIKTKEDVDRIIAAINNGARIQSAPCYSLRQTKTIQSASNFFTTATVAAGTGLVYWLGTNALSDTLSPRSQKIGWLGIGAGTYATLGTSLKNIYASAIIRFILPQLTNGHFDPNHPEPIDQVEHLRGKLTCPTLLHFHKEDGILNNPNEDTIKIYDALKNDKTHIIITDDAWHNSGSQQFKAELIAFGNRYLDLNGEHKAQKNTQPTVEELRKEIFSIA